MNRCAPASSDSVVRFAPEGTPVVGKMSGIRALRHRLKAEQLVDRGNATDAERRHLGERVELSAAIACGDRPAGIQLQVARAEAPRGGLALRDQLIDELLELDAATLPDTRRVADGGVEGRRVAGVQDLHVAVTCAGRCDARHDDHRQDRARRGGQSFASVSHDLGATLSTSPGPSQSRFLSNANRRLTP